MAQGLHQLYDGLRRQEVARTATLSGSNRRFTLTTGKTIAFAVLVSGLLISPVKADPISWTSSWASSSSLFGGSSIPTRVVSAPYTPPTTTQSFGFAPVSMSAFFKTPTSTPTPIATATPVATAVPAATTFAQAAAAPVQPAMVDAFINMGTGPYPGDSLITTGGTQPWYDSTKLNSFFGGQATSQQRADFAQAVIQDVQQTFSLSGVPVSLTGDPNVPAAHTLSLVSNTQAQLAPNAIGMTQMGASGFSFIDQIAGSAQNLTQLQWIVAHNISHELMLAFGVGENHDTTGNYIDARDATWAMMTDPNSTFSPSAVQDLLSKNFQSSTVPLSGQAAQVLDVQPVPEPTTLACWALAGTIA
ncbi:hypothetical protein ACYOEI_16635, partial [Singulisphaera rosea]